MGYQSDLTKSNKPLLTAINKHNDNYSSLNLDQDLILVTALISIFLQQTDFTDMELFSINRKELCEMIELKRRLFETNIKLRHLIFVEDFQLQKANAYSQEDFHTIVKAMSETLLKHFPHDKVIEVTQELEQKMLNSLNR